VTGARLAQRGFTLVELTIALLLMAAMSAVLFGSLSLAARSWDGGENKVQQVGDMRATETYLRSQLSSEYPQRLWKAVDVPLLFSGERDEIRYAAILPARVADGGVYYFRLAVVRSGEKSQLVQERVVPDLTATQEPDFRDAERSVLGENIAEIRIGYFGRDARGSEADEPRWYDRWEDKQRLPMLIRLDVRPTQGPAWPTLIVEPRHGLEAGCPVFDPGQTRCVKTS